MPRKPRKSAPPTDGTHVFRCRSGVCTVRIVECPTHVHLVIGGRRLGLTRREDREWERFILPLVRPYEDDPRPLWIDHTDGSRRALVHKTADKRILVGTATRIGD